MVGPVVRLTFSKITKTLVFLAAKGLQMSNFGLLAQIAPPQLRNMTRKADVASALNNTIIRRGKLELTMLEQLIFRCQQPKENRWL